jgi:hypothetical protein
MVSLIFSTIVTFNVGAVDLKELTKNLTAQSFEEELSTQDPVTQKKVAEVREERIAKEATQISSSENIFRSFVCLGVRASIVPGFGILLCKESTIMHSPSIALVLLGGMSGPGLLGGVYILDYEGAPVSMRDGYFKINGTGFSAVPILGLDNDRFTSILNPKNRVEFTGLALGGSFIGGLRNGYFMKILETQSTRAIQNRVQKNF